MKNNFKKLHIALTISFLMFVLPVTGLITKIIKPENTIFMLLMILGIILFYIILGVLAVKKNRSAISWVGLSIITSPIGPIVSYFIMLNSDALEPKNKQT